MISIIAHPEEESSYQQALLDETIIDPPVESVVERVTQYFALGNQCGEGTVVLLHAHTMFAGKSSVENDFALQCPPGSYLAFQPIDAARSDLHKRAIVDRRPGSHHATEAIPVAGNDIVNIIRYVLENNISPRYVPFLIIDEVMLFTAQQYKHSDAIDTLEVLRRMGFHVLVAGVNRTFQGEDFTMMRSLAKAVLHYPSWGSIQMKTQCPCGREAIVTARFKPVKPTSSELVLASYYDQTFEIGEHYSPRCNQLGHVGCLHHPGDYAISPWPISDKAPFSF